jgi:tyrosinase
MLNSGADPKQGSFLSWHRYYTWSFERVLQQECGYTGTQPVSAPLLPPLPLPTNQHHQQYWDWGRWAADPEKSPIFDGSDTSLSGNGEKIQHRAAGVAPAGNGGGCVKTGPFKEYVLSNPPPLPSSP